VNRVRENLERFMTLQLCWKARAGMLSCSLLTNLEAASVGSLRNEIGLSHEFIDVLKNWPETRPGFLIIDALDAARSESSANALRQLIAAVLGLQGRWRVVVSIRKYDVRYSPGFVSGRRCSHTASPDGHGKSAYL
jgi:hypothetical protein